MQRLKGGPSMCGRKRKRTPAENAEKRRRRKLYMTVFIGGKQKRVRRPPAVEGLPVDEFIRRNADPVWLCDNEVWELLDHEEETDSTQG
jgi:16S rRNA U516 pseudouridylate synthase RsuA-like enzyme